MLITSERTAALRCPLCGRLNVSSFTVFDFGQEHSLNLECHCGFVFLIIDTTDFHDYVLQLPCLICESTHYSRIQHQELWESPVYKLSCPEHEAVMGYIGNEQEIRQLIDEGAKDPESIINDEGFNDYFKAPEIMYQIMGQLHAIANRGDLYCSCGQTEINVEVYPDRLELHCTACRSLTIVYAENAEDLQAVMDARVIELTEKGFTSIDSSAFRSRNARSQRKADPIDNT
ncbi:MAG TPA: hypothetical protein DHD79_00055 [Firmicutes bacterium]|nr:hypothetical protein [Bacillota bacterium]HAW70745.1 hypothetical protein [Bacillota bacterium]HAZ22760.1 hypothetical protein [Bacillota bacterium]HBE07016.1 hypothetical protein [Bacillota bacterium]HBG44004.1 hypothetical protein [Bacillota bacterium]